MTDEELKRFMQKIEVTEDGKHNHPFDEENTYINTRGQRECKTCRRQAFLKWKAKVKGGDAK